MTSSNRIRSLLQPGLELRTPSGRADFSIEEIGADSVAVLVGEGRLSIKVPFACFERIGNELLDKGWTELGAIHGKPEEGTLDWIVQSYTGGVSAASYVAPILEYCGLALIDRERPNRVRVVDTSFW